MFRAVENLTDEDRSADTTRIAEQLNQFRGAVATRHGNLPRHSSAFSGLPHAS